MQYAIVATISTHARPTVHQRHNRRDPAVVQAEDHIDPNGQHEEWIDIDEQDAYRGIFADAVERYNERQQREDRRITADGYYQDIKAKELAGIEHNKQIEEENKGLPAGKKKPKKQNFKHSAYEMIVGVYGYSEKRDENGQIIYAPLRDTDGNPMYEGDEPLYTDEPVMERVPVDPAVAKEILREFFKGWAERNPHLILFGAYYHADEQGKDPHLHLDYVPVATGYSKGLDTQVAVEKALNQQGFVTKNRKDTAQIQWERRENEVLEQLCNQHGITIVHPQAGTGVSHRDKITYQRQKDAEQERQWAEAEAAKAMRRKAAMEQDAEGAEVWAECARAAAEDAEHRADFAARKADEETTRYAHARMGRVKAEREAKALEARTATLRQTAASYPTDLQQRLDSLTKAQQMYQEATAMDDGGPLVRFLRRLKIKQRQPDGTAATRSVYDIWLDHQRNQEQQLHVQADRARRSGVQGQRQIPPRLDGLVQSSQRDRVDSGLEAE